MKIANLFSALIVATLCAYGAAQSSLRASVPAYHVSADFREVANRASFRRMIDLKPEHLRLLQKNLFVVSPRGDKQLYWVYGVNDYNNLPSFISVDTVLHLYHVFYDSTLRSTEERFFMPKLRKLAERMADESARIASQTSDADLHEAAVKNAAYFAVGAKLLGSPVAATGESSPLVESEMGLIGAATGFADSPIFGRQVDYTHFIVRGHYTKSDILKSYFKAMMWFGLIPFELAPRPGEEAVVPAESIRQAMLAVYGLYHAGLLPEWQAIYEPTCLFVGESNNITPVELNALMEHVYGPRAGLDALAEQGKFSAFVDGLKGLRKAKIRANRRGNMAAQVLQFRFMGQRYIPDSEILQRVTNRLRPMPTGLDVMAVLGSARSRDILNANLQVYNPFGWADYFQERAKLEAEFQALPQATWNSNLYWSWLDAMKPILDQAPQGYPSFMKSVAWQTKSLSTALASWAELRHDTILYGSQSVAEMGGDDEKQPFVKGYVEPNVVFYDRLLALIDQTKEGLRSRKLLTSELGAKYTQFAALIRFFRGVSIKELQNHKLTKDEYLRIRQIEGDLADLTERMLAYGSGSQAVSEDDLDMALVADVHTGGMKALEAASGHADDIVVIVPIEGKLYFARGAVMSYYEFQIPINQRMTDEAWKAQLNAGKAPPRPHWTGLFYTPTKAIGKNEN